MTTRFARWFWAGLGLGLGLMVAFLVFTLFILLFFGAWSESSGGYQCTTTYEEQDGVTVPEQTCWPMS